VTFAFLIAPIFLALLSFFAYGHRTVEGGQLPPKKSANKSLSLRNVSCKLKRFRFQWGVFGLKNDTPKVSEAFKFPRPSLMQIICIYTFLLGVTRSNYAGLWDAHLFF